MKKHIVLSLLIINPVFTHTMENESSFLSSFSSLNSYLPEWLSFKQAPIESKLVSDIRASKNEFERELLRDNEEQVKQALKRYPIGHFFKVGSYPFWFLQYCYYQEIIEHLDKNLSDIASLTTCKNIKINDSYTALGAAIISREPSIDKKRYFIQKLLNSGFELTSKDIELAELIVYDGIIKHQVALIHLLHAYQNTNWSILPQELRAQIAQYMFQLIKNEFWLLPEKLEGII